MPVEWYRCLPSAEPMPFYHAFGNTLFYTIEENQFGEIGEQPDDRQWSPGPPIPHAYGTSYCGKKIDWQNGLILTIPPLIPLRRRDTLLACCQGEVRQPQPGRDRLIGQGYLQAFATPITWVVPPGVTKIFVRLYGGGGYAGFPAAGGPIVPLAPFGGGGGGGAYAGSTIDVTPGDTLSLFAIRGVDPTNRGYPGNDCYVNDSLGNTLMIARGGWTGYGNDLTLLGGAGGSGAESMGDWTASGGRGGASAYAPWISLPIGYLYANWGGGGGGVGSENGNGTDGANAIINSTFQAAGGIPFGNAGGFVLPNTFAQGWEYPYFPSNPPFDNEPSGGCGSAADTEYQFWSQPLDMWGCYKIYDLTQPLPRSPQSIFIKEDGVTLFTAQDGVTNFEAERY